MKDLIIKDTITDLSENEKNLILESFSPVVQSLNDFGKQFPEIQAMETGDEKCKKAKRFRIDFGKQITAADAVRKNLKEESLKKSKAVQTVFNYIKKATEETKQAALDIELHFEKLEEEKRKRKQAERENELLKYESDCSGMDLGGMDETIWNNFLAGTKSNYDAQKEADRKAEEDRVEAERILYLHADRKNSVIDLWQFMPEENRNVNFGEWADDMWDELVNYLYLAKADYDKKQAKIKAENEQLRIDAEKAEKKRLADEKKQEAKLKAEREKGASERKKQDDIFKAEREKIDAQRLVEENKLAKKKKDRVEKYSKKLLESGYQSDRPGVYVLGMYRVIDTQLETLTDKEFQDRLTECKKGHERDLQLKKEQEDKDRLEQEAREKEAERIRLEKEKLAEREAAAKAPDKEKLYSIATKLRNTKTTVKSPEAIKVLEDAAVLIEKIAGGM